MKGNGDTNTLACVHNLALLHDRTGNSHLAEPMYTEVHRRVHGSAHPNTLTAMGNLGGTLMNLGEHAKAGPLLKEAVAGLTTCVSDGHASAVQSLNRCQQDLACNDGCLTCPSFAARFRKQIGRQNHIAATESESPIVRARIVAAQQQELIGTMVQVLRYKIEKDRYVIRLPPVAAGADTGFNGWYKGAKMLCAQSSIVLEPNTTVVVVGLTSALELNNRRGIVVGFNADNGRYVVRVDDQAEPIISMIKNIKPNNCRAIV